MDLRGRSIFRVVATALIVASVILVVLSTAPIISLSQSADAPLSDSGNVIGYKVITDRQDAQGVHPVLMENSDARDPTLSQLMAFLSTDDTASNKYSPPTFTCADFAQMLQNHAEEHGIRGGYTSMRFVGKNEGHAVNIFDTTDMGPVYVDTTDNKPILTQGLCPGYSYFNLGTISSLTDYW